MILSWSLLKSAPFERLLWLRMIRPLDTDTPPVSEVPLFAPTKVTCTYIFVIGARKLSDFLDTFVINKGNFHHLEIVRSGTGAYGEIKGSRIEVTFFLKRFMPKLMIPTFSGKVQIWKCVKIW